MHLAHLVGVGVGGVGRLLQLLAVGLELLLLCEEDACVVLVAGGKRLLCEVLHALGLGLVVVDEALVALLLGYHLGGFLLDPQGGRLCKRLMSAPAHFLACRAFCQRHSTGL